MSLVDQVVLFCILSNIHYKCHVHAVVHVDYTFLEDTLQLVRGKSERWHESASESTDHIVCSHLTWQESKECRILGTGANEGIQGLAELLTISSH